jgi:hypothetical protein
MVWAAWDPWPDSQPRSDSGPNGDPEYPNTHESRNRKERGFSERDDSQCTGSPLGALCARTISARQGPRISRPNGLAPVLRPVPPSHSSGPCEGSTTFTGPGGRADGPIDFR